MSRPAIYTKVGSRGRAWALQILDETGQPVDLTSATSVTFSMAPRSGGARKVDGQAAEVGDGTYTLPDGSAKAYTPTDGVLIYQPVSADVDTDEVYIGEFTYQLGGKPVIDPGTGYLEIHINPAV